jgi:hypothetical protein
LKTKNSIVELKKAGRKPKVSLEQIIDGADLLKSQRREITGWTLRDAIGAGGPSYLISEWEQYQAEIGVTYNVNEEKIDDYILPAALEDKRNILIADVSLQINNFAIESDALANTIAEKKARSAYETMMQNNKKLVEEQDLASRLLLDADLENEKHQEQISLLRGDNKSHIKSIGNLQSKLDKTNEEYTRAKFLLAQAQSDLIDEEKKRSVLEKLEIKLNTKLEDAVTDKKSALNQLENLKTELITAQANYTARDEIIREKDKRLITLENQLKKLDAELSPKNL